MDRKSLIEASMPAPSLCTESISIRERQVEGGEETRGCFFHPESGFWM